MTILIEEEVEGHYRTLKILQGNKVLYSIDHYARLNQAPSCDTILEPADADGVRICYKKLSENCEAVILIYGPRIELVNLRLLAGVDEDPARGSPSSAKQYCLEILEESGLA